MFPQYSWHSRRDYRTRDGCLHEKRSPDSPSWTFSGTEIRVCGMVSQAFCPSTKRIAVHLNWSSAWATEKSHKISVSWRNFSQRCQVQCDRPVTSQIGRNVKWLPTIYWLILKVLRIIRAFFPQKDDAADPVWWYKQLGLFFQSGDSGALSSTRPNPLFRTNTWARYEVEITALTSSSPPEPQTSGPLFGHGG